MYDEGDDQYNKMEESRIVYMTARWPGSWGTGRTIEEARYNCRRNSGMTDAFGARIVFLVPEGVESVWVDGMGQLCWRFPEGTDPERLKERAVVIHKEEMPNDWLIDYTTTIIHNAMNHPDDIWQDTEQELQDLFPKWEDSKELYRYYKSAWGDR